MVKVVDGGVREAEQFQHLCFGIPQEISVWNFLLGTLGYSHVGVFSSWTTQDCFLLSSDILKSPSGV